MPVTVSRDELLRQIALIGHQIERSTKYLENFPRHTSQCAYDKSITPHHVDPSDLCAGCLTRAALAQLRAERDKLTGKLGTSAPPNTHAGDFTLRVPFSVANIYRESFYSKQAIMYEGWTSPAVVIWIANVRDGNNDQVDVTLRPVVRDERTQSER